MPLFLEIEYRMPSFPKDPYGFTLEERLQWSKRTLRHLLQASNADYCSECNLGGAELENGKPLYNQQEWRHMDDVHKLILWALRIWKIAFLALFLLALFSWRTANMAAYYRALRRGAWLTLFLIGAIVLFSVIAFNLFFDLFHRLLFNAGTWTFYESDTFIRLFPERFWQDVFLWAGAIIIIQLLALLFITKKQPRLTLK